MSFHPTPPPGLSPPRPGSQRRQPEDHRGSQAYTRTRERAATTVPPIGMDSFENAGLRDRKGIPGPPGTDRPGKRREKGLRGLSPVAGDLRLPGRPFPARGRGGRSSCSRGRRRRSHRGSRRSIRRGGRRPPARSRRSGRAACRSRGPASRRS